VLFKTIGDAIAAHYDFRTFKPQDFLTTAWAFATIGFDHHILFKKIGDGIVSRDILQQFIPQQLSNVVWAYATSCDNHPELFRRIGDEIASRDNESRVFFHLVSIKYESTIYLISMDFSFATLFDSLVTSWRETQ